MRRLQHSFNAPLYYALTSHIIYVLGQKDPAGVEVGHSALRGITKENGWNSAGRRGLASLVASLRF